VEGNGFLKHKELCWTSLNTWHKYVLGTVKKLNLICRKRVIDSKEERKFSADFSSVTYG